jgi:hypothetical protein
MTVVPNARTRLRHFLQKQLLAIEGKSSPEAMVVVALLRQAVEGLDALSYGQTTPIFAKTTQKHWGVEPYTARNLRLKAVGFVAHLHAKGYTVGKARHAVARAYGRSTSAIEAWQKDQALGKTTNPDLQSIMKKITKAAWNEDRALKELKKAGNEFKLAMKKKKKGQ